ncbi:DHA2 family efflux MFS transporter permease subunit [Conexibacter sp. CPCC 206217]|nr:DHA2 family efflux MFS transporter permease subunit [Conexibacter sp. CPCC 206217]MDO8209934.1 DHA2 family efflux MFS transporter permease subunit [Conexibacter sp. CPCC 206217]
MPDAPQPDPRRFLILAICCMSLFIVGVDATAVNIALPSIRNDLGASVAQLQWTVDAYTLTLASLLLLAGSTADRLGRARIFKVGLSLFSLGSLLCSIAPNVQLLIAARVLQAIGGSMLNPVAMGIVRNTFTDPRERAQAIGIWGGTIGVSMALGPVLGGLLVQAVDWRAIFWINVPVGIAAYLLTTRFVPESKAARARRVDAVGQVLVILLLATLTYAIIEAPAHGWTSSGSIALFGFALVLLIALVRWELRRREPLIDMRFFRSAPFSGATGIAVAAFAGLGGFLFLNTLYLQEARDLSPLTAGLWTLPMAAMTVIGGPLAGRLLARAGARPCLLIGGVAMTLGALLLTSVDGTTSLAHLFAAYVLFGIGFGFVNPPITNTAVSGMPADQAGVAAAVASTSRQFGSTLGVAVVGAIAVPSAALASDGAIAAAGHTGWWLVTGCGLLVLLLGIATTSRWANGTAARAALAFDRTAAGT